MGSPIVERIDLTRQATVRDGGDYQPLRTIQELDCWPSLPDFAQLVEGEELRNGPPGSHEPYDLESYWTPWPGVAKTSLVRGNDFDIAVLGIPVAAHPFLASELMAANPAFDRMVREVKTTRTLAFQLWFKDPWSALGWEGEDGVIMDGYFDPFNTMSDMSHLLPREQWNGTEAPRTVAYFCGPMKDDPAEPGFDQHGYPATQWQSVRTQAESFLDAHARHLFPAAVRGDSGEALDYDRLFDAAGGSGSARLDAQFFRCNIDPNERYVLSVKGSTRHRLRVDESGFANLVLAGDWTLNGLNVGCVEASVMSGMQAARAIHGSLDTPIAGDLPPRSASSERAMAALPSPPK